MADFKSAYYLTMGHEGGYANDPDDVGGETYKGIARNYHSSWEGWKIVDMYKKEGSGARELNEKLKNNPEMIQLVEMFYKQHFWDVNRLDSFRSQHIANEMFDTGVNMGTTRAAEFLQKALNVLNKNGQLYEDLVVDGKIGPKSISALNNILDRNEEALLYKIINVLQGNHYIEFMNKSPVQEKFARGWFNRVNFLK